MLASGNVTTFKGVMNEVKASPLNWKPNTEISYQDKSAIIMYQSRHKYKGKWKGTKLPTGNNLANLIQFANKCSGFAHPKGMIVTGGKEGGHRKGSLHHVNRAVDIASNPKNTGLTFKEAKACAKAAGYTHGLDEGNHYHFEYGSGSGFGNIKKL